MRSALARLIERSKCEREDWHYTDVEKILNASSISQPVNQNNVGLPSCAVEADRLRIVFENGVYAPDQSQLQKLAPAVFQAKAGGGYSISLAAQSCLVTAPIELVFVGQGEQGGEFKLSIDIGANASATIIEHHLTASGAAPQVLETDIRLGAQSKLVHRKIMHHMGDAPHFSRIIAAVAGGAFYRNFILVKDTRAIRHEIDVSLSGELAQCGLFGALLLQHREHADILTRVRHNAPHGTSHQLYKAIVKDQARGVFQGRIAVAENAQKTDGKQLCRALLLSDQAEMDAKPELEINADDVACSHGCAIGDLDLDAMFYLRSRGLSENEAHALLLRAFVDEVIDEIQAEDVRAYVRDMAGRWMNEQA